MPTLSVFADNFAKPLADDHLIGSGSFWLYPADAVRLADRIAGAGFDPVGVATPLRFTVIERAAEGVVSDSTVRAEYLATGLDTATGEVTGLTLVGGTTDQDFFAGDVFAVLWNAAAIRELQAGIEGAGDGGATALLAAHVADHNNPHVVTAAQVGAYTITQIDTLLAAKANTTAVVLLAGSYPDPSWITSLDGSKLTAASVAQSKVINLTTDLAAKAPLVSPSLTGVPSAPTAAPGTNTTQIANTAFVTAAVAAGGGGGSFVTTNTAQTITAPKTFEATGGNPCIDMNVPFSPANGGTYTGFPWNIRNPGGYVSWMDSTGANLVLGGTVRFNAGYAPGAFYPGAGLSFGWNKSGGDGETVLGFSRGAGSSPRLDIRVWDSGTQTDTTLISVGPTGNVTSLATGTTVANFTASLFAAQTEPGYALVAASSTTAGQAVGGVYGEFSTSTHATRAGDVWLGSSGYNGRHEGIRCRDAGTFAQIIIPIANVRDAADDAAAAALSPAVPVGGLYRTGSVLKIRVS